MDKEPYAVYIADVIESLHVYMDCMGVYGIVAIGVYIAILIATMYKSHKLKD